MGAWNRWGSVCNRELGCSSTIIALLGAMGSAVSDDSDYGDARQGRACAGAGVRACGVSVGARGDERPWVRVQEQERARQNTSTTPKNSEIVGALRARRRHGSDESYRCLHAKGWMGEGGALPSSP